MSDISTVELYNRKQLEYLMYFLRYKKYTHPKEKSKMRDICLKIRNTVEEMSFRNQSPSIFSSETLKEKKMNQFINQTGLPNFTYKNEYQAKMKGFWDKFYLFGEGEKVKVDGNDAEIVSIWRKLPPFCEFGEKVKMKVDGEIKFVNTADIQLQLEYLFNDLFID